jgi:bisphosphoglycerate-independent phosphoglycerate mutase (AlkP superfamily)
MNRLDGYLKSIWDWAQSNSAYRNKTTMIITTDHGRGDKIIEQWRSHGSSIKGSKNVWLAIIGPDTPSTGEIENSGPVYSNQIAMTIARLLDVDYKSENEIGTEIKSVIK